MSIASEITRLQGAKADIRSAIEAKGVTVPSSAKLDTYDDYIAQITGGGGADVSGVTATAGDVIIGKDFVNSSGTLVHGSMTNRGAVSGSIDGLTTTSYTIQEGYHNGSGTVSLTDDIENTLKVMLYGPLSLFGTLYYIDPTAEGTYTFYDDGGAQVNAPTVGTYVQNWTCEVTGANKPKYYFYSLDSEIDFPFGNIGTLVGADGTALGTGETNTEKVFASLEPSAPIYQNCFTFLKVLGYQIVRSHFAAIGSKDELEMLRLSGLEEFSNFSPVLSSSEISADEIWMWDEEWVSASKEDNGYNVYIGSV